MYVLMSAFLRSHVLPCRDFIDIFNRLYVSRLFPPSWHQLTLHCGWQGPSAGGPYYSATASAPTTGAQGSSGVCRTRWLLGPVLQPGRRCTTRRRQSLMANAAGATPCNCTHVIIRRLNTMSVVSPTHWHCLLLPTHVLCTEPIPSSTWCCNPQFRLTVRKACEIVVSLGQQDPRVEAR
jgi:hypothetical protein